MGHQAPDVELPTVRPLDPPPPHHALTSASLSPRNWRVTWRLIALIAIPTMMGLTFGALRVADADTAAGQFRQVEQLALLGQQVTGLEQAMEDERDLTAGYIATPPGLQPGMLTQLRRQYKVTDTWSSRVESLAAGIGASYPAQAQNSTTVVLATIGDLPGVRLAAQGVTTGALPMIIDYTSLINNLLSFDNQIAQGSASATLTNTARTLGSLTRVKEDASLQRAILYSALLEGQFELGAPEQLSSAQAQQTSDESEFTASATLAQQQLFNNAVVSPVVDHDQVLETLATTISNPQDVGVSAAAWYQSMTSTINSMRGVEVQLAASVVGQSQSLQQGAEGSAVLTGILSLLLLLVAGAATVVVARSMVRPLRILRSDALEIASVRLPEKVRDLSNADDPSANMDVVPVSVRSVDEIGQVARAFDQVHREAVRLAGNEAMVRNNMNSMFVSLSRRSQSLLERLARLIDSLEQSEDDPGRLSNLFSMDHLVTRMRRHSENLLVLAGHEPARKRAEPVALTDVVRAAVSEILEYDRVVANVQPGVAVLGQSVNDTVHLLAEIIENATFFSAKDSQVHVSGHVLNSGGILIEVADSGVGIPAERLAQLNWRLDNPPVADVSVSRHMGLFAVSHLAARHGVRVRLRQAAPRGLTALVWIPETLITAESAVGVPWPGTQPMQAAMVAEAASGPAGWIAFGRDREPDTGPLIAVPAPVSAQPALTEPVPIYESMASEWFRRGSRLPAQQMRPASPVRAVRDPGPAGAQAQAAWKSPADAGWRAAESAATPVRGQLTSAGLPQRIPRANMVPGSVGERGAPGAGTMAGGPGQPGAAPGAGGPDQPGAPPTGRPAPVPAPQRRSADAARARLAGFQRGTRRGESAAERERVGRRTEE
ncbi:MAG: nitrate- and nitrite sensing domain-containing protein [Streptosporangiaceae bacterium]|nr:nitrate- and nitrite sensing domain-containing protein [Streptosporangiaceae bacterium]